MDWKSLYGLLLGTFLLASIWLCVVLDRISVAYMEKQPKRIITHWLLQVCQAYFLADLIWVAKVPICVKSPNVIIKVSL